MLRIDKENFYNLYNQSESFEELWDLLNKYGWVLPQYEFYESDVKTLALIYRYYRIKARLKSNELITETSKHWETLVKILGDIELFEIEFNIVNLREAIILYLESAMELKYLPLNLLKMKGDIISLNYKVKLLIGKDENPKITKALIDGFIRINLTRFGHNTIINKFDKGHFIEAAKKVIELGITPEMYLEGLFDLYSWTGSPLTPNLLMGEYTQSNIGKIAPHKPVTVKVFLGKGADRFD